MFSVVTRPIPAQSVSPTKYDSYFNEIDRKNAIFLDNLNPNRHTILLKKAMVLGDSRGLQQPSQLSSYVNNIAEEANEKYLKENVGDVTIWQKKTEVSPMYKEYQEAKNNIWGKILSDSPHLMNYSRERPKTYEIKPKKVEHITEKDDEYDEDELIPDEDESIPDEEEEYLEEEEEDLEGGQVNKPFSMFGVKILEPVNYESLIKLVKKVHRRKRGEPIRRYYKRINALSKLISSKMPDSLRVGKEDTKESPDEYVKRVIMNTPKLSQVANIRKQISDRAKRNAEDYTNKKIESVIAQLKKEIFNKNLTDRDKSNLVNNFVQQKIKEGGSSDSFFAAKRLLNKYPELGASEKTLAELSAYDQQRQANQAQSKEELFKFSLMQNNPEIIPFLKKAVGNTGGTGSFFDNVLTLPVDIFTFATELAKKSKRTNPGTLENAIAITKELGDPNLISQEKVKGITKQAKQKYAATRKELYDKVKDIESVTSMFDKDIDTVASYEDALTLYNKMREQFSGIISNPSTPSSKRGESGLEFLKDIVLLENTLNRKGIQSIFSNTTPNDHDMHFTSVDFDVLKDMLIKTSQLLRSNNDERYKNVEDVLKNIKKYYNENIKNEQKIDIVKNTLEMSSLFDLIDKYGVDKIRNYVDSVDNSKFSVVPETKEYINVILDNYSPGNVPYLVEKLGGDNIKKMKETLPKNYFKNLTKEILVNFATQGAVLSVADKSGPIPVSSPSQIKKSAPETPRKETPKLIEKAKEPTVSTTTQLEKPPATILKSQTGSIAPESKNILDTIKSIALLKALTMPNFRSRISFYLTKKGELENEVPDFNNKIGELKEYFKGTKIDEKNLPRILEIVSIIEKALEKPMPVVEQLAPPEEKQATPPVEPEIAEGKGYTKKKASAKPKAKPKAKAKPKKKPKKKMVEYSSSEDESEEETSSEEEEIIAKPKAKKRTAKKK